jgi:hypothetical protein
MNQEYVDTVRLLLAIAPAVFQSPQLPRSLTKNHRDFLLSLLRAEPEWGLLPFANLQHLPALQWKLLNLRKLKSRDARRFAAQEHELAARLATPRA